MSSKVRGFARKRVTWSANGWFEKSAVKLPKGQFLDSQVFSIKRDPIDTEWKLALYPLSDDSGKVGVYVDMIKVKASSENFSVRVSSFAKMGDGRLEKLEKFSKEASRLFKDGERVLKIRGDFLSSNSAVSVTELLLEIELIEDENFPQLVFSAQNGNYEKLLDNEDLSDFCFTCSDGGRIRVNKCVIAIQCLTFSAMLHAEMEEVENGEVEIDDIDSETMLELLRFLYCGKVKDIEKVNDRLLAAANKYGVNELIPMCVSSLIGNTNVENVLQLLALADLYNQKHLKENCIDLIKCKYETVKASEDWETLSAEHVLEVLDSAIENPASVWLTHVLTEE